MILADKLTGLEFPKFPEYNSLIDWSSYNLDDLVSQKFNTYRNIQTSKNLNLFVGDTSLNEEELSNYIIGTFKGVYYDDVNNNKTFDAGIDQKLGDIKLFISPDGAYLLEQYDKLLVNDDQMAIFLEVPDNDLFSDKQLLVKAGKNASKYTQQVLNSEFVSGKYPLEKEEITALISSLGNTNIFLETLFSMTFKNAIGPVGAITINWLVNNGIGFFTDISDFFGDDIRLDEKRWNKSHPDYSLKFIEEDVVQFFLEKQSSLKAGISQLNNVPDFIQNILSIPLEITNSFLEFIKDFVEDIENSWAFICGLWNGLVDLFSDLFSLIVFTIEGIRASSSYLKKSSYYNNLLLEYVDNLVSALQELNWAKVLKEGFYQYSLFLKYIYTELPEKAWDIASETNKTEVSYYSGYVIFQFIEFILPPLKIAKLAKASKVEPVVKFFDEILGVATTLKAESRYITEQFFKYIKAAIEQIKLGDEAIVDILKNLFETFKEWIDNLIIAGRDELFAFIRKLPSKSQKFINKIPFTERLILNDTILCYFNGKLIFNSDPKGVLSNLKIYSEITKDKQYITQIRKASIYIKDLDTSVREDLFVRKRFPGQPYEKIEIIATFKNFEKRKTEISNAIYHKSDNSPPYKKGTYTIDKYLKGGDEFYVVEYERQKSPGNFGTTYKVKSIEDLRRKLAVKEKWKDPKDDKIIVRKYKVAENVNLPVREGIIGSVLEDTEGAKYFREYLMGGEQQYEFLNIWDENDWTDYLEKIDEYEIY